jgi:hypothetical protein
MSRVDAAGAGRDGVGDGLERLFGAVTVVGRQADHRDVEVHRVAERVLELTLGQLVHGLRGGVGGRLLLRRHRVGLGGRVARGQAAHHVRERLALLVARDGLLVGREVGLLDGAELEALHVALGDDQVLQFRRGQRLRGLGLRARTGVLRLVVRLRTAARDEGE